MSQMIQSALSNLNSALDRLEISVEAGREQMETQQRDLFAAQSALNDNAMMANNNFSTEHVAKALDQAINKVEELLKEGEGK